MDNISIETQPSVGLIGLGRMGHVLAVRLAGHTDLWLYDRDLAQTAAMAEELGAKAASSLEDIARSGTVILAVPDREVISCIKDFNLMKRELNVINIATNVAQHVLEETAAKPIKCIGVKFIGHAGEMALGLSPVIIINERPASLVPLVQQIFAPVGQTVVGKADIVRIINTAAAEKALEAAVYIEDTLRRLGYTDADVIRSAIRQVAAGVLKAYADNDLGPFAREIVRAVRAKLKSKP